MRMLALVLLALSATPTLEERVATLETNMAVCCGTEYGLRPSEEEAYNAYVQLKKRLDNLEERVDKLENNPK